MFVLLLLLLLYHATASLERERKLKMCFKVVPTKFEHCLDIRVAQDLAVALVAFRTPADKLTILEERERVEANNVSCYYLRNK